jgi:hypothetical protein
LGGVVCPQALRRGHGFHPDAAPLPRKLARSELQFAPVPRLVVHVVVLLRRPRGEPSDSCWRRCATLLLLLQRKLLRGELQLLLLELQLLHLRGDVAGVLLL